ncbi:DnaJ-like subfamily C member 7 [Hondaea fermentalgiana]|uniref:DnaJ-like subfamily C member 7 n=1 Tax=Hondaea fermentalgiana TaxID=2315210 RepID=A0A2R5G227_9STRA|nr:DnaJ-like subfamily C member 7 [Hondaea fermentalgiana]|eukprot:GBG25077.1 DnaJ-like subfamily C member 7 [Hondaea fermentalgiana]
MGSKALAEPRAAKNCAHNFKVARFNATLKGRPRGRVFQIGRDQACIRRFFGVDGAAMSRTYAVLTATTGAGASTTRRNRGTARRSSKKTAGVTSWAAAQAQAEADVLESSFMSLDDDDVDGGTDFGDFLSPNDDNADFPKKSILESSKGKAKGSSAFPSSSSSSSAADENSGAEANLPRSPTLRERAKRAPGSARPSSHRRTKKRRKTSNSSSPIANLDASMFDSAAANEDVDDGSESSNAKAAKAQECKNRGNEHYAEKDYELAVAMYSQAIELEPQNAVFYGNRAAAQLMQARYKDAIADCDRAIELDPGYVRARVRAARASLALGDIEICKSHLGALVRQGKGHTDEVKEMLVLFAEYEQILEDCDIALSEENAEECERLTDRALQIAPASRRIWMCKQALKLLRLGASSKNQALKVPELQGVRAELEGVVAAIESPVEAQALLAECYLYAKILLYCALTSESKILFAICHKIDPADQRTLRRLEMIREMDTLLEKGATAFGSGDSEAAIKAFDAALQIDAENKAYNGRTFFRRAAANMALHRFRDAIVDCNRALINMPLYHKARVRRAHAFIRLGDYKTAVSDLEKTYRKEPTATILRELKSARSFLENAERKERERKAAAEFERKKHEQQQRQREKDASEYFRRSTRRSTFASGGGQNKSSASAESTGAGPSFSSSYRSAGSRASSGPGRPRATAPGTGTRRRETEEPQHGYNTRSNSAKKTKPERRRRSFEPETKSHYQVLGLPQSASTAAVKKAYKQKALRYHPDKCKSPGAEARFKRVAEAYRVLKSPSSRRTYDAGTTRFW